MHVACIASCIHVTKNSNNALTTAGFTLCLAHVILTFGGFVTSPIMFSLHKSQYRRSLGMFEYRPLSTGSLWLQLLSFRIGT